VISGGEGKDLIEVIAFDPVLKLAGFVAGVIAYFEHGDYNDFYGDGFGFRE